MGGAHTEQVFWSLYQTGICQEILNFPSELFLASYSSAYQYNRTRAEPLYQMAAHFFRAKNVTAAYAIAKSALALPKPKSGNSIENWIYDYGLGVLFADCAIGLGKRKEAEETYRFMLKRKLPKEVEDLVRKVSGSPKP